MNKILFVLLFTVLAAMGCVKDDITISSTESVTTIEVVADIADTRTYYDGSTIHWADSGEKLNIIYFANDNSSSLSQTPTHSDYNIDSEGRISFKADLSAEGSATSYTVGALYPYAHQTDASTISLAIPQVQRPTIESFDPTTDILVSREPVTIASDTESVKLTFSRMVAFAKMTLKGIGRGEIIEKVVFSSSAKPRGSVEFKVHQAATLENAKWQNTHEDITITREEWIASGEDVVWMTTIPTDLSGSDFTVIVETDRHTYTKSVDLTGKSLNFKRGDIATFSVTFETRDISGTWHLTEWRGTKPSFDIYMSIDDAYGVTLWQRFTSREWERYDSTASFTNNTISGTYSDGTPWSTSYSVTIDVDTMTWIDTSDSTDISVYMRSELPEGISATPTTVTRSGNSERFL